MDLLKVTDTLKSELKGTLIVSESMSRHTTWRIGGPADLFFTPLDCKDLENALNVANFFKLPITIIGGGSNLLIRDEGIRGLVINISGLKSLKITDKVIVAEAGVRLPYLARQVADKSLTGLEFAAGIPGTLGGAVIMNAGAHGGAMENVVKSVVTMDYQGQRSYFTKNDLGFTYRASKLKTNNYIVIEVSLKLKPGFSDDIKSKMEEYLIFRKTKQPWEYPNAGSVFKNPPGDSAGRLIESVGLKGYQVGDAQISEKHANFIVNHGGAKCSDVLALIEKVQGEVYEKYGIGLEPEIQILGG
ncbi:MAG: UDP-N-acetylmuramate dehydrogenase [Peptococcales bacterium]|jgi:UDP-N-acetylmuramate dehydrogenase